MSSRRNAARHRADTAHPSQLLALSKSVAGNAGGMGRQAAVIAAASGLVLTSGIAAQAADAPAPRDSNPASNLDITGQAPVQLSADSRVKISFERPAVTTTPAPVVEAPKPAVRTQAVEAGQAPAPVKAQVSVQTPAPAAQAAPAAGGVNAAMVSAAYAQLGLIQDCTALVEKALGAAGIPVGDLAPMQFMNYGRTVGDPQPGDMVIQPGHIGIYVGDGQVLSSGMNGQNQTVVHPLSWLTATGPVTFVRAGA
ncbi:NlpC/P60 family protein [Arthrobacter sp. CC3]|uniref:NlpC/P60 family protein n=1 Tax=Arthrobacter sp. CC3 TaxID=3029185 RepID=UPI0032642356